MHTIRPTQTTAISIDAPFDAVWAFISDPRQLPRWAPGFATEIRPDGEHWIVSNAGGDQPVRIRVDPGVGTVDFLAPAAEVGAYSRLVANGAGCEYLFTVFLPPDATPQQEDEQRAIIVGELEAVRAICETVPAA